MDRTCADCRHFDKLAYPDNPRFGKCLYQMPPLPMWLKGSSTNNVADYYNADHCATFASDAGPRK